jgi:hypothetical protein
MLVMNDEFSIPEGGETHQTAGKGIGLLNFRGAVEHSYAAAHIFRSDSASFAAL